MIAKKYEPTSLVNVIDHTNSTKVMQAIVRAPEDCSKIIVISGNPGTGKTVISKAFAYDLNYIAIMQGNSLFSLYKEYNANQFNTEESLGILESFLDNDSNYIVINIEEADLIAPNIQVKLLELIERASNRVFFIFTTTDKQKIITPIRNRGMQIDLENIQFDTIVERLKYISNEESIDIEDSLILDIANRASGNLHLAYDLLDKYKFLGKELFEEYLLTTRIYLIRFLAASFSQDKDKANEAMQGIMKSPLYFIKQDYESLILELLKVGVKAIPMSDKYIKALHSISSNKTLELFRILNDKLLYDMFNTDNELQSALWYIYIQIGKLVKR